VNGVVVFVGVDEPPPHEMTTAAMPIARAEPMSVFSLRMMAHLDRKGDEPPLVFVTRTQSAFFRDYWRQHPRLL
jgi:hypothetical protein